MEGLFCFRVLRLCLLELTFGGLGTTLGTADNHSGPLQSLW